MVKGNGYIEELVKSNTRLDTPSLSVAEYLQLIGISISEWKRVRKQVQSLTRCVEEAINTRATP